MHLCVWVCICVYLCVYVFMCVWVCLCVWVCVYVFMCMWVCMSVFMCLCVCLYVCTGIQTHTKCSALPWPLMCSLEGCVPRCLWAPALCTQKAGNSESHSDSSNRRWHETCLFLLGSLLPTLRSHWQCDHSGWCSLFLSGWQSTPLPF